jgi:hypothetical protein
MATKRPKTKWKFAIGTTSFVPDSKLHYLIVDIDTKDENKIVNAVWHLIYRFPRCSIYIQPTRHGYHLFTNIKLSWMDLRRKIRKIPFVDLTWIGIGESRGYFFLADKGHVRLSWKVRRMILRWEKNMKPRQN